VGIEIGDGCRLGSLGARGLAAQVKFGFDLRKSKRDGAWVSVQGEGIDPGTAGVSEAEELGDFVVGFTGGIVHGPTDEGVVPGAVGRAGEIEMGVSTGDDEGEGGFVIEFRAVGLAGGVALVEEDGVDVALKMVDGDERDVLRIGESLCVGDANEEGSGKAWA